MKDASNGTNKYSTTRGKELSTLSIKKTHLAETNMILKALVAIKKNTKIMNKLSKTGKVK